LQEKLSELAAAQRTAVRQFQEADRRRRSGKEEQDADEDPPLVRVAVRAGKANEIWDPVFHFLYEQNHVLLDEIGPNDSLVTRHSAEPCHGFLILCDDKTQSDDALSPRDALAQCRLIQSDQQKLELPISPVAVVFLRPPDPVWPRLLKATPRCLYRVLGDNLENGLREFLEKAIDVQKAYDARRAMP